MYSKNFGINGKIIFEKPIDDFPPFVTLYSKDSHCKIALHGAHVLSFVPNNSKDILWLSSDAIYEKSKAIRGGIPICLPWFGSVGKPSHGFARISEWSVVESGLNNDYPYIKFFLELLDEYRFELFVEVSDALTMILSVENLNDKEMIMSEALHSYFNISDIENVFISGLEGKNYIDSLDHDKIKKQEKKIFINAEIDRIYQDTEDICVIEDSGFNRKIIISKENSKSTVVWNPWIKKSASMVDFELDGYRNMVCVESANIGEREVILQKGEKHNMQVVIEELCF